MLLFSLIQHLFIGIVLRDMHFYIHYIWPLNMIILGIASIGVFIEKENWKKWLRNFFLILIIGLPLSIWFNFEFGIHYMLFISAIYALFFSFILYEILLFLFTPNYINLDIITAAICGYLLLIEIATFLFQLHYYYDMTCFTGIHLPNPAEVFSSFVYFSSVTITSIGFGDIRPMTHYTKLLTSLIGVAGQLYSILLVGIIISKFSARKDN
jgi:hypothetical protein